MKTVKRQKPLNGERVVFILFLFVSFLSAFIPYFNLDVLVSNEVQSINSLPFDKIMWFISTVGNQPLMVTIIGVTGLLLYLFRQRVEAVILVLASAGSALSGSLIKVLIDHPRPTPNLVRVSVWLSDKSYPSNHVLVFTVFFGFLIYLLLKKISKRPPEIIPALIFFLFILTIGISRIYLGAHWASDVLGGYLLGVLWLMLTIRLYNSYNGKR